ncbi:hypothetical protein L249_5615 [Ophiocordyceps polyrhachis-furcata BCC 54312]|uniref:Uncharacterized protein n=1 Tax=Ophiocordyceps polyrhachis-furcata BCC 54312 TaxID=1330021 RepID=A0A367LG76_9HYPO|nr:hypothetical protein L249_5615 [Ophiocordyceps polyrhachis-furcata BCC 54312]
MKRLLLFVAAAVAALLQRRHSSFNETELLPERRKCSTNACFMALVLYYDSHWPAMERFCSSSKEAKGFSHLADDNSREYFTGACPVTAALDGTTLASGCDCVAQGRVCAAEDCRVAMETKMGGLHALSEFCFTGTLDDKHLLTSGSHRNKSLTFPMSLIMRDGGPACFSFDEVRMACSCSLPKDRKWQFPECRQDFCYASLDMLLGEATKRVCRDMLAGRAHAVADFGIERFSSVRRCDFEEQLKACRCTQPEPHWAEDYTDPRPCRQTECYRSLKWVLGSHVLEFCDAVLDTHASWEYSLRNRTDVDEHIKSGESYPALFRDAASLGCDHDQLIEACRCVQPAMCAGESCFEEIIPGSWNNNENEKEKMSSSYMRTNMRHCKSNEPTSFVCSAHALWGLGRPPSSGTGKLVSL